jgi:hypothetical protein
VIVSFAMMMMMMMMRVFLPCLYRCAILCGLTVAQNFRRGQALLADRDFADPVLVAFFRDCFEVGRRHKVMNPEKMRDNYGKLVYMLMDSAETEVRELLGFKCVRPLRTVHLTLEEGGALALLDDPLLESATAEITAAPGEPRHEVQRRIKAKERARTALAKKYRTSTLGENDLLRCMYSVGDNNSYLAFNRDPVDRMIEHLKANFNPDVAAPGASLAIQGGAGGARLTHSHSRQYAYVLQSLTLWREIAHEMFKLWWLAENDLLREGEFLVPLFCFILFCTPWIRPNLLTHPFLHILNPKILTPFLHTN